MALTISGSGGGLTLSDVQAGAEWNLVGSASVDVTLSSNSGSYKSVTLADIKTLLKTAGNTYTEIKVELDFTKLKLTPSGSSAIQGYFVLGGNYLSTFLISSMDAAYKDSFVLNYVGTYIKTSPDYVFSRDYYQNLSSEYKGTSFLYTYNDIPVIISYLKLSSGEVKGSVNIYGRK